LVSEEREVRLAVRIGRDDLGGSLKIERRWRLRMWRGGAQEAADREDQERRDDADRGAEKTGSVAAHAEPPPEVARILDVLVAEETEPCRRDEDEENGRDPSRSEAFVEKRPAPVEVASRRHEAG